MGRKKMERFKFAIVVLFVLAVTTCAIAPASKDLNSTQNTIEVVDVDKGDCF